VTFVLKGLRQSAFSMAACQSLRGLVHQWKEPPP
jgi:hypothetical protein